MNSQLQTFFTLHSLRNLQNDVNGIDKTKNDIIMVHVMIFLMPLMMNMKKPNFET